MENLKVPLAVLISDIHFNSKNLSVAKQALIAALDKANTLQLPIIIAGDLHDTKRHILADVANELIEVFKSYRFLRIYVMIGNHDLINEKSTETALQFLQPWVTLVRELSNLNGIHDNLYAIPYQSSQKILLEKLALIPSNALVIAHQGLHGAYMGEYTVDSSSIDIEHFRRFKAVISGHYHKHQQIENFTYIGSPYTITYAEANDGPKGFLILNSDGSYTRQILNLRKHIILDLEIKDLKAHPHNVDDLIWVKLHGIRSELDKITKEYVGTLIGTQNFKLDIFPTEENHIKQAISNLTAPEILDNIIDKTKDSDEYKQLLKTSWRQYYDETK